MPVLHTADGIEFDKGKIFLYAYRHSYAQRHADAGVPVEVLRELMSHRKLETTSGYYRVGETRRREAVDRVTAMQFDRHGNRIWRQAQALLDSEHARRAVGEVAVPFGVCAEPSNVKAGGGACPFRFRCAGCDHFRTDVSYLPDLHAYLDDLLRTRERLLATTELDEWARAEAMPSEEEIRRIRRLIDQIASGLEELNPNSDNRLQRAVTVVRRHRSVMLGMPRTRQAPARPAPGEDPMTTAHPCLDAMIEGRRADSTRRRQRGPVRAGHRHHRRRRAQRHQHRQEAPESTARSSTATATCSNASTPRKPSRPDKPETGPPVTRASLQADLLAAQQRAPASPPASTNSNTACRSCSASRHGAQSGLGAPADIDALQQKITHLEQQVIDLRLQLEERDQDLNAARAANRELMTQINTPATTRQTHP